MSGIDNLRPEPGPKYVDTPEEYKGPIKYINWNGYKIATLGARLTTEFFDQIASRRQQNRSVIIIITGSPGEGKSYEGLRFAQIFDPKFKILDVDEYPKDGRDPSQVPFERNHFLYLVGNESPLKYGQCIVPDEAQYTMGSRRWYEDIQKDLMESIESVRSRGYIIVIVALHLDLLDKIIRKFVLTYMFHMEDRGKATIYRLYTPRFEKEMRKRRLGQMMLKLPDFEKCTHSDCLRCNFLHGTSNRQLTGKNPDKRKCMTLRAVYERRKRDFVGSRSRQAQAKADEKALKQRTTSDEEMAKTVYDHRRELSWTKRGRIDTASIMILLEDKLGISIGTQKAYKIRSRVELRHPELKPAR